MSEGPASAPGSEAAREETLDRELRLLREALEAGAPDPAAEAMVRRLGAALVAALAAEAEPDFSA